MALWIKSQLAKLVLVLTSLPPSKIPAILPKITADDCSRPRDPGSYIGSQVGVPACSLQLGLELAIVANLKYMEGSHSLVH